MTPTPNISTPHRGTAPRGPRTWSLRVQVLIVLVAGVLGGGIWQAREQIARAIPVVLGVPGAQQAAGGSQNGGETSGARAASGGKRGASPSPAVPVIVERVRRQRDMASVAAVGTGRALRSVTLFPRSDGVVTEVAVAPGDRVDADATILTLDRRKAELEVELAQKRLENEQVKLERAEFLKQRRVNSTAGMEDAKVAVDLAEIAVRQAQEALRDTAVVAPFAGVLGIAKVERGDRVTTQMELVTLDDRSAILVEFDVPEGVLPRLRIGQPVAARSPGFAARTFEGTISAIDARVDPTARTVRVRASIDNAGDWLRPGMSFAVALDITGDEFIAVPELALQYKNGKSFVWRVSDGAVERVSVTTVKRLNAVTLVSGPLAAGELVVVEGVQRLRPGRAVRFEAPLDDSEAATDGAGEAQPANPAPTETADRRSGGLSALPEARRAPTGQPARTPG